MTRPGAVSRVGVRVEATPPKASTAWHSGAPLQWLSATCLAHAALAAHLQRKGLVPLKLDQQHRDLVVLGHRLRLRWKERNEQANSVW